ncbi:MAG: hypothetical protein IKU62_06730 [Ruminiclostridium sp.]|nr:hypothetical protein [Ruminiclostridium sp.]
MVSKLRDGDYYLEGGGIFARAEGAEALLERVMFKLQVRRGSFPLMPRLGSRLYLLPRAKASARAALGASYAAEALAEEEVAVTRAEWEEERRRLTVFLRWQGEELSVGVTMGEE